LKKYIVLLLLIFISLLPMIPANAMSIESEVIDMHHKILRGVGFHASESSNLNLSKTITTTAAKSTKSVTVSDATYLHQGQLIVIYSNSEYYTNVIDNISNLTINLIYPLEVDIASNDTLHNFYNDPSHPNLYGYRAIADTALRNLTTPTGGYQLSEFDQGVHMLLGDSWFVMNLENPYLQNRLKERLPHATFINYGVGGNEIDYLYRRFTGTATLTDINSDTVNYGDRKDATVIPSIDYVWVMCGTNDYHSGTSPSTFKNVMDDLMKEIIDRGAKPLIFTSSVGRVGVGNQLALSQQYADLNFKASESTVFKQGTWTPTLVGFTTPGVNSYSNQSGSYYKSGKMIVAQFDISLSTKDSAMVGSLLIKGLPYKPAKGSFGVDFAQVENVNLGASYSQYGGFAPGDYIVLTKMGGTVGNWNNILATDISSTTAFRGSITYFTD
jgi:lysophospholipase L1-like esterase